MWNTEKNEDGTYKVTVTFDHKNEIVLQTVPGQYVEEDGQLKDKKELTDEESLELVNKRMQSLFTQLQQSIFTINFYGGKIEGSVTSGPEAKKEEDERNS